jgi:hypothetical protein
MVDDMSGLRRIFIPMRLKDNPYLRDNQQYYGMLMSQDESTRRMWMLGEWTSSSVFFTEWRPKGPITFEEQKSYPWARHVIESADLKPWWYRFGGGDWGYNHPSVFHKCCRSEKDGKIHVYDELTLRQTGSFEIGVKLALWWMSDLEDLPDKSITIAFSPDAFSKTDATRTKAEQIADGINSILGPYGSFLMKYTDEERAAMEKDPSLAQRMFNQRRAKLPAGQMCIVLKPASQDTVARWSFMRELLRFRPVVQETEEDLKKRLMETYSRAGVEAYERELSKIKRTDSASLPKLQVWSRCGGLIRCMEEANRDENNPEKILKWDADAEGMGGDDALDSCAMGLHYFKMVEPEMPKAYFLNEKMEQIQSDYETSTGERITDLNRLIAINQHQTHRYDMAHPAAGGSFNVPRASSSRHRSRPGYQGVSHRVN